MKKETDFRHLPVLVISAVLGISLLISSCNNNPNKSGSENKAADTQGSGVVSEQIKYTSGKDTLIGYIFYDNSTDQPNPGILVVPEWWGNNDYPRMRARQLAEMGYTAFSIDMYGNGLVVDNPEDAQKNATVIYSDPSILKNRMMAAYETLANHEMVEKDRIAAIGYCFGGSVVLNAAAIGVPLDAVVSFHGSLEGFKATPDMKKTHVLVCNGRGDEFVTRAHIRNFKDEMEKAGAHYEFKEYDGATHAFTNPNATETGKKFNMPIAYNETADKASWQDMKDFLEQNFPSK